MAIRDRGKGMIEWQQKCRLPRMYLRFGLNRNSLWNCERMLKSDFRSSADGPVLTFILHRLKGKVVVANA